jgi:DNA/RNA endonuclease G (NUC1)
VRRKNVEFYEDKCLDARFRSRLVDFKDSGYDRGHMVRPLLSFRRKLTVDTLAKLPKVEECRTPISDEQLYGML